MAKNVLLIEDDLSIQKIYTSKLNYSGFEVMQAYEAVTAFHLAKNNQPNIIILDIMLPGKMNGFELLEKLMKNHDTKKIPVLVLTNLDTEKESALKIGAKAYLVKASTDLNEIVSEVKKYIR